MNKSKVAVIKVNPDNIFEKIYEIFGAVDFRKNFNFNKAVILKDNISWHMPFLSANTTPWQLEGIIKALIKEKVSNISAVHNNTVVTNPVKGGILNKLTPVYKKYNIKELFNFKSVDISWKIYKPHADLPALNKIFPEGIEIPEYFIGKNIIHLPTVKCHIYTTTTGSMKNAFGGLLNTRRHYTHSMIHETLVDLLSIQKEIHPSIFTLMDGTLCGNGPGPRTMIPVEKDYMLASFDSVAIDSVAAKMMGFDPMRLKFIYLADEKGLGNGRPENIEIIGEDIKNINFNFNVGHNFASRFGHALWFSPLKKIQKFFFKTPLVYLFILGSFIYHDYIWWPTKGKKIQNFVRKNSKWGKFFENYDRI